jgi:hypothetical protein
LRNRFHPPSFSFNGGYFFAEDFFSSSMIDSMISC